MMGPCYLHSYVPLGLENMANEEWIIFRSKSYKFEEFLQKWQDKLKVGDETTSLTVRLLQEVDKFKVSYN